MKKLLPLLLLHLLLLSCNKDEVSPQAKQSIENLKYFEIYSAEEGDICLDDTDCQFTDTLFITTNKEEFKITARFEPFSSNYLRIFEHDIKNNDTVFVQKYERTNTKYAIFYF